MVKKIRVIEADVTEATDGADDGSMMELAKSMDWKLWEILQILQRFEKKLNAGVVLDDD